MLFEKVNDYAFALVTEAARASHIARQMVIDAEIAAAAKHTAQQHTNCRKCQAGLENFLIEFPDASSEIVFEKVQELWETCPDCIAEYDAWADAAAEEHRYPLEVHAHNGDDLRWQNGGVK